MTNWQLVFRYTICALVWQVMTGGVVSTIFTTCWHVLLLPQSSKSAHLLVAYFGHVPLVTAPSDTTWTTLLGQQVEPIGGSNDQVLPHSTVLLVGHNTSMPLPGLRQLVSSARIPVQ